jgi:myo-inositol-1(or 4)-monophosphatase
MLDFAVNLGKKSGEYLRDHLTGDLAVEYKGIRDLVTRVDRGSQELIVREIEQAYPGHSILAEEGYRKEKDSEFTWIIDPLDGTVNFVHHIPFFCVSIALYKSGKPYLGVCYNPMSDEIFQAMAGEGAFLNDRRIRVSETVTLMESVICTGFPYQQDEIDLIIERFERVVKASQGVRRFGSAALDLCYVAAGMMDAFWEIGLKPWDMAAGVVILQEAGGMITLVDGRPFDLESGDILASNRKVHEEIGRLM